MVLLRSKKFSSVFVLISVVNFYLFYKYQNNVQETKNFLREVRDLNDMLEFEQDDESNSKNESNAKNEQTEKMQYVDDSDLASLWVGSISSEAMMRQRLGGLLTGLNVSIVVAHCDKPVDWLWRDFKPTNAKLSDVIIYSKCGNEVQGAPPSATIIPLPNVGRCDHTYAHHMANLNITNHSPDDVIIFIKDNPRRFSSVPSTSYENLVQIASINGFACVEHNTVQHDLRPSYYHIYSKLASFVLDGWSRELRDKNDVFKSTYHNLGSWADHMKLQLPQPIIPVCYGGVFAASITQIYKQKEAIANIEKSLSRGDNIEEGHFCERIWAGLLSKPLSNYAKKILLNKSSTILYDNSIYCGNLAYQASSIPIIRMILISIIFTLFMSYTIQREKEKLKYTNLSKVE